MPVATSEIVIMLSTTAGSAGASTTQGSPSASLGKYVSTTALASGTNNGLFDDVSGSENAASTVDYRCVFIQNNNTTLSATDVTVFISSEVSGGASVAIAVDTTAISAKTSSSAQALTVANETTAPSGLTFVTTPINDGTGLAVGTLAPNQVRAFWVRRTAANTAALSADGVTFGIGFTTVNN